MGLLGKSLPILCQCGFHSWEIIKSTTEVNVLRKMEFWELRRTYPNAREPLTENWLSRPLYLRVCTRCGAVDDQINRFINKNAKKVQDLVRMKLRHDAYSTYELTGEFPVSAPPPRKKQ